MIEILKISPHNRLFCEIFPKKYAESSCMNFTLSFKIWSITTHPGASRERTILPRFWQKRVRDSFMLLLILLKRLKRRQSRARSDEMDPWRPTKKVFGRRKIFFGRMVANFYLTVTYTRFIWSLHWHHLSLLIYCAWEQSHKSLRTFDIGLFRYHCGYAPVLFRSTS